MNFFKKHPLITNLLIAIIVFFLLVWIVLSWLDVYTRHDKSVQIPNGIVNSSVDNARALLAEKNLQLEINDTIYVKSAVPGTIQKITPPEGNKVKEERVIYATVYSKFPPMISVPDVVDMSQRQAMALIKSIGFENVEVKMVDGVYRDLVLGLESRGKAVEVGDKLYNNVPLSVLVSSGSDAGLDFLPNQGDSVVIEATPEESWF